jgi:hypothetical protein
MGMYPWVIPFSGAAMANDSQLIEHTEFTQQHVRGTDISWRQPARILPLDPQLRRTILTASARCDAWIGQLQQITTHIPSRIRSFVWIMCLAPLLEQAGYESPSAESTFQALLQRLPKLSGAATRDLTRFFNGSTADVPEADVYAYV